MKTQFSKMPRKAFGSRQLVGKSFKFANSMRTSILFAKNARKSKLMSHLKIVPVGISRCMYLSSPDGGGGGGGCGAGHFTFVVVNQTTHNHYYGKYRTTFRKKEHAEEVTFEDVTEKKKDATVEVNVEPDEKQEAIRLFFHQGKEKEAMETLLCLCKSTKSKLMICKSISQNYTNLFRVNEVTAKEAVKYLNALQDLREFKVGDWEKGKNKK